MKVKRAVTAITAVAAILSLFCLVAYFLALHDIQKDYVSPAAIHAQSSPGSVVSLPVWSACSLEWRVLQFCFLPMVIFHLLFFVSLAWRTARRPHAVREG